MQTAYFSNREHAWFVYRNLYRSWISENDHPKPEIDGSSVVFAYERLGKFEQLIKHLEKKTKRVKVKVV